jgi:transposase
MRSSRRIELKEEDRAALERIVRAPTTEQRVVLRARIVLLTGEGSGTGSICERLATTTSTVTLWRKRFEAEGVGGLLKDARRSGRRPTITKAQVAEVLRQTQHEKPAGATQWSTRTLAPVVGLSPATISRIWRAHGLKPHRVKRFKLSSDPLFAEKLEDVAGLYIAPPEKAVVFSVDEKSQIQALDRTQPGLPMKKGRAGTMTHDYKRNGTTTLFAALNVATGEVIDECMPRHRHDEFLLFLKKIEKQTDKALDLHIIADNYATHKHPAVNAWLAAHPRVQMHFTPTSSSWVNLVERFFAEITDKAIRNGTFKNVRELEAAIRAFIETRNRAPRPYVWTASVASILAKVDRARRALAQVNKTVANSDALH